jgi:hypothetical protein
MADVIELSEEQKLTARRWSALGFKVKEIALGLGVNLKTLRTARREIKQASIEARLDILKTLWQMAHSGDFANVTMFYARTQCGWNPFTPARP